MLERWRPIAGYVGRYSVSDQGRVWSVKRGAVLRQSADGGGYYHVGLYREGRRVTGRVHRLVLKAFVGPCPANHEAGHLNDMTRDNRLENLTWITHKENVRQCLKRGRFAIGKRNGQAQLVAREVLQIRRLRESRSMSRADMARKFNVSATTITRVVNREVWAHLPAPSEEVPDEQR